jgi:hypothetical protein
MTYGLKFVYFSISCTKRDRDREREASTTNYEINEFNDLWFKIRLFLN